MIGMILCGGYGKRLRPLTEKIPKPLVELKNNYTILHKQIFDFASAGIEKIVLLAGYKADKIEERFGNKAYGVKIIYVVEEEPQGTLNAIRLGTEAVDCEEKTVIIRNGDIVTDINLRKMIDITDPTSCRLNMFVTKMQSPYGVVELGEKYILSFREKPLLNHYINGGIYVIPSFTSDLLGDYKTGNIEKTVFPELAHKHQLMYYREDNIFWIAIDTEKELTVARKEYVNRIDKPWGYEKILINTEKYLTKQIYIKSGYQTSMHYHTEKDETMYVISGEGYIEYENGEKKIFTKNDTVRIEPGKVHTIVATENTVLYEVSTPHPDDTIRVKDFYPARADISNNS